MDKLLLPLAIILGIAVLASVAVGLMSESPEAISPSDTISSGQIQIYDNFVILNIPNAEWAEYTDTNSMVPVIDIGANGITIKPVSEEELKLGDIVSYLPGNSEDLVVHRIVEVSEDEQGAYYTMKGDNNSSADPEKVRFSQIRFKTIAIIY